MHQAAPSSAWPHPLESPSGLRFLVNRNGSIQRIDHRDIILNLFLGNELEGGPANIYLRRLGENNAFVPLLGPRSPGRLHVGERGLTVSGDWGELRFRLELRLAEAETAWFWHVRVDNRGSQAATLDLIHVQDLALAPYGAVRLNEYFVSQYVDHTPLSHHERGWVLASRQNQSAGGRYPWSLIGALGKAVSFATDSLQVDGLASRAGLAPPGLIEGLPGTRLQHEHGLAALQEAPFTLAPGETAERGFFGRFVPDHPEASSVQDLTWADETLALPESRASAPGLDPATGADPNPSLFSQAPLLETWNPTDENLEAWFGTDRREPERDESGELLSFFHGGNRHVALRSKELQVLRPHGQILRTGALLTPDEASLTTTAWMAGVFHSMITQGHVSINRFSSSTHSYLSLFRSHGIRLFVELAGQWQLLDLPSAFEMASNQCRWFYRYAGGTILVSSRAPVERHELSLSAEILSGPPLRFLLSAHLAVNGDDGSGSVPVDWSEDEGGVFIRAIRDSDLGRRFPEGGFRMEAESGTPIETLGGDGLLFLDGQSRSQPYLCAVTAPSPSIGFRFYGRLVPEPEAAAPGPDGEAYWATVTAGLEMEPPPASPLAGDAARLGEILPWFAHNALIHYLAPRGLEQYSGGGWGTRDVCQGPVEMLLALGRTAELRDLLLRVFAAQNPDGDWPQWFMFFDRERNIRPGDSHGDIVFWPLLALGQYLIASGDGGLLDEIVPYFHPEGDAQAERASLAGHMERALDLIRRRTIPGTRLAVYGHGDWNDALQPVDPLMRERLCSSWTVTLHFQALSALAQALKMVGRDTSALELEAGAEAIRADFQGHLIVDEVLAGYLDFRDDGSAEPLVHPRDGRTGLKYSLLPMIHAIINGLLTPDQARRHLELIRAQFLGPDGARLFDRPMEYRGGPQRIFQRAESAANFGREIGLMYTHAHLRYAEALAHYGDADGFFRALCQANPIGLQHWVPMARLRQLNCYYSSSDAAFPDRYQAHRDYQRLMAGEIPLEGGWRVYSSGAGIALGLILRGFLGFSRDAGHLIVDPVVPKALDGLSVHRMLGEIEMTVRYRVAARGCGPHTIRLNGVELPFARRANPYRPGAAAISLAVLRAQLSHGENTMTVELG